MKELVNLYRPLRRARLCSVPRLSGERPLEAADMAYLRAHFFASRIIAFIRSATQSMGEPLHR